MDSVSRLVWCASFEHTLLAHDFRPVDNVCILVIVVHDFRRVVHTCNFILVQQVVGLLSSYAFSIVLLLRLVVVQSNHLFDVHVTGTYHNL
jgi:hypothetical protein